MFYRHLVVACATALLLSACAVHPLPENFEGFNTVQIVERIRCEASRSLKQEAINLLRQEGDPLGDEFQADPDKFYHFDPRRLRNERERYFYYRYVNSAIVYAFTFDISEDNAANTEVDLAKAVTGGTVSLALKAGGDFSRENSRALVVSETFQALVNDRNVCTPKEYVIERQEPFETNNHDRPNFAYPVTGSIGLFEVVKTFIDLNEEGLLGKGANDKAPVLTDTLTFTTTLTGSANPQVMLSPVGHHVGVSMASLTNTAMRKDYNKVIVALSLFPKHGYERAQRFGPFVAGRAGGASVFARQTDEPAVQRALDAISQQRIDTFYDKFDQAFTR